MNPNGVTAQILSGHREINKQCQSCEHWKDAGSDAVYGLMGTSDDLANYYQLSSTEQQLLREDAHKRLGMCHAPCMHSNVMPSEGQATCVDSSEYQANLVTTGTFGCTLWEER